MMRLWRVMILGQTLLALGANRAGAADAIVVTRQSAVMINSELTVSYRWISSNPVSTLRLTVGAEEKTVTVDPGASRRTPTGYEGAATSIVPVDTSTFEKSLPYALVLLDAQGTTSGKLSGMLALKPPQTRSLSRSAGPDETPPSLGMVKTNRHGGNSVSFSTVATDNKGLHEVRFTVLDAEGRQLRQQILTALGKHWEGMTDSFTLPVGSYQVIAKAVDSSGNDSAEQRGRFDLYDVPRIALRTVVPSNPLEVSGGSATRSLGATSYRLVRIPAPPSADEALGGANTRALGTQGGYYLKITSQGGLGDVDRIAAEVARSTGGEVVDPGAIEQTRGAFGDASARQEATIQLQASGDSRFPFMAAIDLFCYGTSLFKMNICKNSADVAVKVAGLIGGVVTKVYDAYATVFGQTPTAVEAQGAAEEPARQDGESAAPAN